MNAHSTYNTNKKIKVLEIDNFKDFNLEINEIFKKLGNFVKIFFNDLDNDDSIIDTYAIVLQKTAGAFYCSITAELNSVRSYNVTSCDLESETKLCTIFAKIAGCSDDTFLLTIALD